MFWWERESISKIIFSSRDDPICLERIAVGSGLAFALHNRKTERQIAHTNQPNQIQPK